MKELTPPKKSQIRLEVKDLEADKASVEGILLKALEKYQLYDNTYDSTVPDTIRSILQSKGIGFGLGARVLNHFIFIDFNPNKGDAVKFSQVHDFILKGLEKVFDAKLTEVFSDDPRYCPTTKKAL